MASFQFPAAPTIGQIFTPIAGVSYKWTGVLWAPLAPVIGTMAVGNVIDFAGLLAKIPPGYLNCDGSAISRAVYPELFAAISTTWGVGDGSTTFNLPNLSRRTTVGSGGAGSIVLANAVGSVGGEENHVLTVAELAQHSHVINEAVALSAAGASWGSAAPVNSVGVPTMQTAGSNTPHNTMQPSAVMLKIICATPQAAAGTPAAALTSLTNSLAADVLLNNVANYFDGPSVAQGTSGLWLVTGGVCFFGASSTVQAKLWDGTTVIANASAVTSGTSQQSSSLSGVIASPAGNLRISVRDITSASGKLLFNQSGNSKDSTITAVRIG